MTHRPAVPDYRCYLPVLTGFTDCRRAVLRGARTAWPACSIIRTGH